LPTTWNNLFHIISVAQLFHKTKHRQYRPHELDFIWLPSLWISHNLSQELENCSFTKQMVTTQSCPAGAAGAVDFPPTMPPTRTPISKKRKDPPTAPITIPAISPAERLSSAMSTFQYELSVGAAVLTVGAVVGAEVGAAEGTPIS